MLLGLVLGASFSWSHLGWLADGLATRSELVETDFYYYYRERVDEGYSFLLSAMIGIATGGIGSRVKDCRPRLSNGLQIGSNIPIRS